MAEQYAKLDILCEDGPVLAVNKPSGMISQGAPPGSFSLVDHVKHYLKVKYDKPGDVYLGIPHRLDRPVSGVIVFSRNSKCAARLTEQFAKRVPRKVYRAVLEGILPEKEGILEDYIRRDEVHSRVHIAKKSHPAAKFARLRYKTLAEHQGKTLVEVELDTGRMHQIRIQFASRNAPIVGDLEYGAKAFAEFSTSKQPPMIALHAWQLTIQHPIRREDLTIEAPMPKSWRRFNFPIESW